MQLEHISIENLFGRFDYEIRLRKLERITIIHAPNGFGKTVILSLVNAFFTSQFGAFFKYEFRSLTLSFDTNEIVEIRRLPEDGPLPDKKAAKEGPAEVQFSLTSSSNRKSFRLGATASGPALNRAFPFIEPAGPDLWLDENTDEVISTNEVLQRYGAHLPPSMRKVPDLPDWLTKIVHSTECRLIETQRLLRIVRSDDAYRATRRPPSGSTRAVVDIEARDLANRIGATIADYAKSSQTLEQSFPRRVVAALNSPHAPAADNVSERLRIVDEKRSSLIEAGLIDVLPEIFTEVTQAELQATHVRQVINVYLDDMGQKFSRFDQLFQRVSLFKEIINEKFQFKDIVASREKGISVKTNNSREIPLADLSSGEQHELVLLYELLFGVKDDALILIDEPELSLHVGWQVKFLPDLQRIQKLTPFQVIMATHSPQIINDRWDLTEELKSR